MAILGSADRRLRALQIAASMKRPRGKEDSPPTPEELVEYARVLDDWLYNGDGH